MPSRDMPTSGDRPRKTKEDLGPVLRLMKQLWALDHGLHSASKRMEATHGITVSQRLVIGFVGRSPGISAGTLARSLHVHPSTLTDILRRLESRGVLHRRTDPKDSRRALFGLTPRGRQVDALQTGNVEQAIRRVLERMPEDVLPAERVLAALTSELEIDPSAGPDTEPEG